MFKFPVKYRATHDEKEKVKEPFLWPIRSIDEIRHRQTISYQESNEILEEVAREKAMTGES
jgi:hypothetical protein